MAELKSSYITLSRLRFHSMHGVLAQERLVGNDYEVSIRVEYDVSLAAETDDVAHTLNYADIYEEVARVMQTPSQLIENVAGRIARALFGRWPDIASADISVCKLNPPIGADCRGAEVEMHYTNVKTL